MSISYQSSVNLSDKEDFSKSFKIALEKSKARDLFKKNTGVGPHRDDISFYINGIDASFGSQGQHRSLVLSIKLAEIELMESITTESPILLLDDVMSELDNTRQLKIIRNDFSFNPNLYHNNKLRSSSKSARKSKYIHYYGW